MSPELLIAVVGIGGALVGALVQNIISGISNRQKRLREQSTRWGPMLVELANAGAAIERWARAEGDADESTEVAELQRRLDEAWKQVLFLCPVEVTGSAYGYVGAAHDLLRGNADFDALDGAEQEMYLVYRRVAGINKSIAVPFRGAGARKDIAPE